MKKVNTIKLEIIIGFVATTIAKVIYEVECTKPMTIDVWGMVKYFYTSSPLWITILWIAFALLTCLLVTLYIGDLPAKEK
jgi:formate-dependent nitrite reductase membrane component NrfD